MWTSVRVADAAMRVIDYSDWGGGVLASRRSSYRLVRLRLGPPSLWARHMVPAAS